MKDNFEVNIDDTINSGQVFLWKKFDSKWYGINGKEILILEDKLDIKSKNIHNFFRFDDDFQKIKKQLSKDDIMKKAIKNFPGMRILRQDPFQCYISFIVSSNSNIPNIQTRLQKLSRKFGEKRTIDDKELFLFPKPEKLANASITDITKCGLGYRSKYVKKAAIAVSEGTIDFSSLKKQDYQEARDSLCQVFGIGKKVADCILLFSLDKLEAVPLDRWVLRILQKYYSKEFQISTKTITEKTYDELHDKIVEHFGKYAGYGQQFLFKNERESFDKKWLG
ncbi:DNA repair protein [Candidatus Nitrosopelagicus brevis]|uniref:DNA-(apurinic or apyrimidinic site) lyase n=1 Tax=Candidatus Nitrosopelagicus brevis TaxID=1410606 RepID=A0A0A7V1N1_9ARCH|nr:DNA glycosylase [Candidatus Nitrosopelagicus brevis]AJA92788.1 8-oxoguanine DNA glycosylase, N-terminal domain protein [Candidatus Nitrosopelagicus brevis]PTL88435.1 DNA repair protein [Candidatus Nitrosopelagicus brevis]